MRLPVEKACGGFEKIRGNLGETRALEALSSACEKIQELWLQQDESTRFLRALSRLESLIGRSGAASATLASDPACDEVIDNGEALRGTFKSVGGRAHIVVRILGDPEKRRDFVESLQAVLSYLSEPDVVLDQAKRLNDATLPASAIDDVVEAARAAKSLR